MPAFARSVFVMEPSTEFKPVCFFVFNCERVEWDPEWDKPKKSWIPRPPKGHAYDRALPDRYLREVVVIVQNRANR